MEIAASIAGIGDVSVKILRLLNHIYDDTHGIRSSLKHLYQSIKGLITVLEELREKAADPSLSPKQRQLLLIASTTAHECSQLLHQLQDDVPTLEDDAGLGRKAYAAIAKNINQGSIKEKQELINMYMQSLNVSLLVFQRLSIESVGDNVAQLLGQLNSAKTAPAGGKGCSYVDEYSERMRRLVEAYREDIQKERGNDFFSDARAGLLDDLKQKVDELASQGRFYPAAEKIRTMISIQRDLSPRQDNGFEEITILQERRADLLLQCTTVRCHWEAFNILHDLVPKAATDREKAILYWKMGRLHAVPELLGDHGNRSLGQNHLNMAVSLLRRLSPFPHDILCSATQLIVQVFKDSGDNLMAKATEQEMRKMIMKVGGPTNWQETSEVPRSAALDWCGMKGYPVKSDHFRYFAPVEDRFIEGPVSGRTPLHIAAREGKEQVVKEMLAEAEENDVDIPDSSGSTPLMEGAKACHIATVNALLAHGAKADHSDAEGRTALHWAAAQHRRAAEGPAVVTALLAQETPGLVDRHDDARGETALHLACLHYHFATVECLLAHDADTNLTNRQGQSPLLKTISESDRHTAIGRGIGRDIVRALLAAGANPNTRDVYENTALSISCLRGDAEAVDLLLSHSSASLLPRHSISSSYSSMSAPTYSTATAPATAARQLIFTDVNQRGKRGETPLIIAVDHLHKAIVKKLRAHGANPAEADQHHKTAWDHAKTVVASGELLSLLAMQSRAPASSAEKRPSRLRSLLTKSETR